MGERRRDEDALYPARQADTERVRGKFQWQVSRVSPEPARIRESDGGQGNH